MNEALLKTHSRLTMREVNHYIAKPMSGQEYNCADALYKGTPNTSQALQILQTVGGLGTMSPGLTFSQNAHGQIYLQQRIVYLLKVFWISLKRWSFAGLLFWGTRWCKH